MKKLLLRLFLLGLIVLMSSCGTVENEKPFPNGPNIKDEITFTEPESEKNEEIIETPTEVEVETDYKITYVSGSKDCYKVEGTTIYFNNISSDTIYSISGSLDGNIVINVSNNYKFELELVGFTLASDSVNPITVLGGKEVQISAKK